MQCTSNRQYRAFAAWLRWQQNQPSRTDHYLMRVAQRVLQSQSTKPNEITMEDQRIEFVDEQPKLDPRVQLAIAKARSYRPKRLVRKGRRR